MLEAGSARCRYKRGRPAFADPPPVHEKACPSVSGGFKIQVRSFLLQARLLGKLVQLRRCGIHCLLHVFAFHD
jgi:hypothetical protein